jgi:Protein of unknown function (DUF4019)
LWDSVSASADCKAQDDGDLIIVTCDKTMALWYFTKAGHPAHPGVIKRSIVEDAKGISVDEHGWSFAPDSGQPAFKTLLAQIRALDEQMKENLAAGSAAASEPSVRVYGNWQPQGSENQAVIGLTSRFFAFEDGDKYEDAYELMDPKLTAQMSFMQYQQVADRTRQSVGHVKSRTIKTVDWENKSPSGPDGLYAALDYTADTEKGQLCGFVAWRRYPDGFFTLVREETNILPNSLSAAELAKLREQFHCVI